MTRITLEKIQLPKKRLSIIALSTIFLSAGSTAATFWGTERINGTASTASVDRRNAVRTKMNSLRFPTAYSAGDSVTITWFPTAGSYQSTAWGGYSHTGAHFATLAWDESIFQFTNSSGSGGGSGSLGEVLCPLIIDMGHNGFSNTPADNVIDYDFYGDGEPIAMQWVAPDTDDSFIAIDLNGDGIVTDGTELFGESMLLFVSETEIKAANGYIALQQFDVFGQLGGDNDGHMDAFDDAWEQLILWNDANADGLSTPDEVTFLSDTNITSIDLDYKTSKGRKDPAGNPIPYWSFAHLQVDSGPKKMKVADIHFQKISN